MKRSRLNMLLAAAVFAGAPIALAPSPAMAGLGEEDGGGGSGGTCCPGSGNCYLNLDGVIIKETNAYHMESGTPCPKATAGSSNA